MALWHYIGRTTIKAGCVATAADAHFYFFHLITTDWGIAKSPYSDHSISHHVAMLPHLNCGLVRMHSTTAVGISGSGIGALYCTTCVLST